ncbi:TspO/MBR family protein [Laspinema olomoucense]|uniref:TspO/MBR family protein n=1 Tax=Laspinema olomoucense D3b TaxID=2953688 RepID=A0ABT2N6B1_9CYAN|nr:MULTISPECIES: TspO/MBR family protein [unclassified Laspinema]MCT7978232.1 TspO/MBR family protein [Laspinema sp. D3b]MCT7988305.1 TspO/MBR family protein [Laspinema sp. D3a]
MIKSWMAIAAIGVLVAGVGSALTGADIRWFKRLQRPRWLTFEWAIPIIWTVIFICGGWSAYLVWEADPGSQLTWVLMGFYLVLEIITISYTPVMCKLRSLTVGTIIGATGGLLSYLLGLSVWPVSIWAVVLLIPYMIWSPIGTYTTWAMVQLNPEDR